MKVELRRLVYDRDQGRCGICGAPVAWAECDIDHILPQIVGGPDAPDNLRATHPRCNRSRRAAEYQRVYRKVGPIIPWSLRLAPVTRHDLEQLAWRLNVSQSAAVRIALREACERRGIPPPEQPDARH